MLKRFGQFLMCIPLVGMVCWLILQAILSYTAGYGTLSHDVLFLVMTISQKSFLIAGVVFFLLGSLFYVFGGSYKVLDFRYILIHSFHILREISLRVLLFAFFCVCCCLGFVYSGTLITSSQLLLFSHILCLFFFLFSLFQIFYIIFLRIHHTYEHFIFSRKKRLNVFVVSLLAFFFVCFGFVLGVVPGFILLVRLSFVSHIALEHSSLSVVGCFRRSASMTRGLFWDLLALWVLFFFFHFLGILCAFIGLARTVPLHIVVFTYVYRQILLLSH